MRGSSPGARDGAARVVVLSGSPVAGSRTWGLAEAAGERLAACELEVQLIDLRALPPAEVLLGPREGGAVRAALDAVALADGVVVATPIHHAAYSGLLKAFLDLLPRAGLSGKAVLPLAVGGSTAHVLAIDYALRPVLVCLGAAHVARGHVVVGDELGRAADGAPCLQPEAERRLDRVLREFALGMRLHAGDEAAAPVP
ncbi:MAG TPA: NADPH-dependent FMN reductase [Longimicrobium sp.]|nr:NADPH-dependent FMN reductase [Longimicrobium sp.]